MEYDYLASFYDAFIDEDIYRRYLELMDRYTAPGSLLDIGCGTGTLSVELASRGYSVTATDISEDMLSIVAYRTREAGVELQIFVYDMLDPIGNHFDVVVAAMDVLNHLADLEDVHFGLTNIFEALSPNGVFLFDVLSAEYIDALDGYVEDSEEFHFHWESHRGKNEHSIVHTVTLHLPDGDHDVNIYEQTHDLPRYEELIRRVGFTVLEKIPLPERTIFVCQKKEK